MSSVTQKFTNPLLGEMNAPSVKELKVLILNCHFRLL